jgi:hypothetical protein
MNRVGQLAGSIGRGLAAGLIGTAAMTVSQAIESKLRGRPPSTAPSDVAGKVLGVQPRNPSGKARFATAVHWGYGTGWGAARGLIAELGLGGTPAAAVHFTSVWSAALVMLPTAGAAPPIWRTPPSEVTIDVLHHAVYAAATSVAYETLSA